MSKRHKYGVAPKEQRTYDGIVYHSKAEAIRAQQLDVLLHSHAIKDWKRQVTIPLGEDFKTVVDFVVTEWHEKYAEEVKGVETPAFKTVRRLWPKYAPMDMQIMKRKRGRWSIERLRGATT